jgi:hypothetical protein
MKEMAHYFLRQVQRALKDGVSDFHGRRGIFQK